MEHTVSSEQAGIRVDTAAAAMLGISRSRVQGLIADGALTVNGRAADKKYLLAEGDVINVEMPEEKELCAYPQDLPIAIVYEDEYLLVVDKPRGMVVHPAAGNPDGTLVNALLFHCKGRLSSINGVVRPGIVHRIDKDTSGLLIVAKTDEAHRGLATQIEEHSFVRRYEAVIIGRMKTDIGTVSAPIGRHPADRKKMAVTDKNSKHAVTHWRTLCEAKGYSHLELTLETGRTHQIRVHLSHLGHPVLGDTVYGASGNSFGLTGQCLFARYIEFTHPISGERLSFTAELPDYFIEILKKTGLDVVERNQNDGKKNHFDTP